MAVLLQTKWSEGGKVAELVETEDEKAGVEASEVATLQAAKAAMP